MAKNTQPTGPVTKAEALQMLSTWLRNPGLDGNLLIKIITLQSKIAGWDKKDKPKEGININELVRELERKKKESL